MACVYNINGQEYTDNQLQQVFASIKAVPGNDSLSNEELLQKIKDRFVNMDLFDVLQEQTITNIIFSDIIDMIGVLKPGDKSSMSATDAFAQSRARFGNTAARLQALLDIVKDEVGYNTLRNKVIQENHPILQKFPEMRNMFYPELVKLQALMNNVADKINYDKFEEQVRAKLERLGLRVKGNKFEDYGLTEEYYQSLIENTDEEDAGFEAGDRVMNESFEDGRVFQMNPKDTASTRVKLLFSTIPNPEKNALGKNDFVPFDQVFQDLMVIGSKLETSSYEALQKALIEAAETRPYLLNVSRKLGKLYEDKNMQLINETLTVLNKAFTEHVMVLWKNNAETEGVSVNIIKSNRNSVLRQIKEDWLEQQKRSKIITKDKLGDLMINRAEVTRLQEKLESVAKKKIEDRKEFMKDFFESIGVPATEAYINYIAVQASKGAFKRMKARTFAQLFTANGVFDLILKTYAKDATVDNNNENVAKYDDVNNAMIHEKSFDIFAELYADLHTNVYQAGNFLNGEDKSIYAYIQPSYIESIKKKVRSLPYISELADRAFSAGSAFIKRIKQNLENGVEDFVFDVRYADALRKDDDTNESGKVRKRMSKREMIVESYMKHQNSGANIGYYNIFTLSDKTVTPVIVASKDQLKATLDVQFNNEYDQGAIWTSFDLTERMKVKLYELALGEINRIVQYAKYNKKDQLKINDFAVSSKIFYLFPALNSRSNPIINQIRQKMYKGVMPSEDDQVFLKQVLADSFKDSVIDSFKKLTKSNVIRKSTNPDKTQSFYSFPFFDKAYMNSATMAGLTDNLHKGIMAVLDMKYHYLRSQINTMQILGADPAVFYKANKKLKQQTAELLGKEMTMAQLLNYNPADEVQGTAITQMIQKAVANSMDNFSKRAAMFIAPGSQGTTTWVDMKGKLVDISTYKTITIADLEKDTQLFKGVVVTDGQEFVTLQEHINRMMSEGRIPLEIWQSITDKIAGAKNNDYTLTDIELKFAMQPAKPVHSNNTAKDGFNEIHYVKSSTFPLVPDATRGSELDKLRIFMEKKGYGSANFDSAKKTGTPAKPLVVFDQDGNFIEPDDLSAAAVTQELRREGTRNQQEIPPQKTEISLVTQMDRQLFEGLLQVADFQLQGLKLTGAEFKNLKENIRIALLQKAKEDLYDRLGISFTNGNLIVKNHRGFASLMKAQAKTNGMTINDMKAIVVDKKGRLVIPVSLMDKHKKFEGVLTSVFSKLLKTKIQGTSLVQVSGVGTKMEEAMLSGKVKNEIIYSPNYDPAKGLQYLRKEEGKVKAAQVFISQYLTDEMGNKIDMSKFATKDSNGRLVIDLKKLPEHALHLIGARIPNQLHSSMLPIEIAGFLPSYYENTIIVPDGITAQMGSDFDVDKLYAYTSNLKLKYSKEADAKVKALQAEKAAVRAKFDEQIDAVIQEFKQFIDPEVQADIEKYKEIKKKYIQKLGYKNIGEKERERRQGVVDNINDTLSTIYDSLESDSRMISNRERTRLKIEMRNALEKLDEQIEDAKRGNVSALESVDYKLDAGAINNYEKLMGLGEEELKQMYKDLHWSVLTHEKAFDKITKKLDFDDIPNESDVFEEAGLLEQNPNFLPMDLDSQIQTFIDNKSGKTGTGIFAQLITFLAENQNLSVSLLIPIQVKNDKGEVLELDQITQPGSVEVDGNKRTKTDNTSMLLTESVDNGKNKNLYKFNFNTENMNGVKAATSLSTKEGEALPMKFMTRLFSQQIVKDFNETQEMFRDSLYNGRFVSNFDMFKEVLVKYYNMVSVPYKAAYPIADILEFNEEDSKPDILFNANDLLELRKMEKTVLPLMERKLEEMPLTAEEQSMLDDYAIKQIYAFKLFYKFAEVGNGLSAVMNPTSVASQGVGNNFFTLEDKYRKVNSMLGGTQIAKHTFAFNAITNAESLLGELQDEEDRVHLDPKTQTGFFVKEGLLAAREVLAAIAPVEFSKTFAEFRANIAANKGLSISIYGKDKFIAMSENIMKHLKAYMFSDESGFSRNAIADRERLLLGNEQEKPLGVRIEEAREKYPELQTNYFLSRLQIRKPKRASMQEITTVRYKSPFSQDIDELANNKGFLQMFLHSEPEVQKIAQDLITYSFVTGSAHAGEGFIKYIPVEIRMMNSEYLESAQKFSEEGIPWDLFTEQYMRHNPHEARQIPYNLKKTRAKFTKAASDPSLIVTLSNAENSEDTKLMIQAPASEGNGMMFPPYLSMRVGPKFQLFKKIGGFESTEYQRISVLGKDGQMEYSSSETTPQTIFIDNMTPAERMAKLVTNPDNPFMAFKGNVSTLEMELLMGDVATTLISTSFKRNLEGGAVFEQQQIKNVISVYGKNKNTGEYTADDVIMIHGNNVSGVVAVNGAPTQEQITEGFKVLEPFFNKHYKPLIDKGVDAGASFVFKKNDMGIANLASIYLTSKGYTVKETDLGYMKAVKQSAEDAAMMAMADMENYVPSDLSVLGGDAPVVTDLFGSSSEGEQPSGDGIDVVDDLFGSASITMQRPVLNPGVDDAIPTLNTDIVSKYGEQDVPNTLKSVLTNIRRKTTNPFTKTLVDVLGKTGYNNLKIVFSTAIDVPGEYNNVTKQITINPDLALTDMPGRSGAENLETVLMHEIVHGYTADLLIRLSKNDPSLDGRERVFAVAVRNLFNQTQSKLLQSPEHGDNLRRVIAVSNAGTEGLNPTDKQMYYGLTNMYEFVSMLLTEPTFQQFMNNVDANTEGMSVLERFKALLVRLFNTLAESLGMNIKGNSVLEQGVNNMFNLITSTSYQARPEGNSDSNPMFSAATDKYLEPFTLENHCK